MIRFRRLEMIDSIQTVKNWLIRMAWVISHMDSFEAWRSLKVTIRPWLNGSIQQAHRHESPECLSERAMNPSSIRSDLILNLVLTWIRFDWISIRFDFDSDFWFDSIRFDFDFVSNSDLILDLIIKNKARW